MYLEAGKVKQVVVVNKQYAKVVLNDDSTIRSTSDDGVNFASENDANFKPDFGSKSDNYNNDNNQKPEDENEARKRFFMEKIQNQARSDNTKYFSIGSVDSFERRMDEAQK